MSRIADIVWGFTPTQADVLHIAGHRAEPYAAVDPRELRVEVATGASARLVILHASPVSAAISVVLAEGAQLEVTEIFTAEAFVTFAVKQAARSSCRMVTALLTSANASYTIDLEGAHAENTLRGVFLAAGDEHCVAHLQTNHRVADCRSDSAFKGVAADCAVGEFCGMVYVAPDAQRTDARQQSRNVVLSNTARIDTRPQLEIYADDVKCSHGATVGQMDSDAILYMRQRGLSEAQARQLQIEGFVGDVVLGCGVEPLCEAVMEAIIAKMERL